MVFYFKARPEAADYTIFMGLDKYENEELIKYGFPEDIWFHVDKMSSAHVYLRLQKGQTIDDIPEGVLEDCAQLVKANSIQGNKVNNVDVVYTPWQNLKKTASMDVGQVGFHSSKAVRTIRVEKRINEIVNRLNRTKVERTPDLKAEREAVNAAERAERKQQLREKKRREDLERLEKERQAELRSYKHLMVAEKMTSNKDIASTNKSLQELEEDFIYARKGKTRRNIKRKRERVLWLDREQRLIFSCAVYFGINMHRSEIKGLETLNLCSKIYSPREEIRTKINFIGVEL